MEENKTQRTSGGPRDPHGVMAGVYRRTSRGKEAEDAPFEIFCFCCESLAGLLS